jgi:hypothetical protein
MNQQGAYTLIDAELKRLRRLPYSNIVALVGKPEVRQVAGEDDKSYQLEIAAVRDGKKGGNERVIVAVDDGVGRAFKPLTCDFIMRPDGTFVGESFDRG